MKSVGLNEKVLRDTYYVTLLQFIIDVKINEIDQFYRDISEYLKIIPMFEEENILIDIVEWIILIFQRVKVF